MVAPTIQMPCSSTTCRAGAALRAVRRVVGTGRSASVDLGVDVGVIDADIDPIITEISRYLLPLLVSTHQTAPAFSPDPRHGSPGGLITKRPPATHRLSPSFY